MLLDFLYFSVLNYTYSDSIDSQCIGLLYAMLCCAKSLQSCPTLCDPIDGSPPGSSVHGIFQARVLEWGAIAFSGCYMGVSKTKSHLTFFICLYMEKREAEDKMVR